jgi:hypothetical protein
MILLRIVTGMLTDHLVVTYCTVYKASRYRPGAEMGPYSKYANVQVFNFMHVLMISRCFAFCIFFFIKPATSCMCKYFKYSGRGAPTVDA